MLESLREMWAYRALIVEFVRRDLKLRYKNSVGGIAWSVLNPLMQVGAITFVMKFFKENPVADYSAYLLGVLFLWNFVQAALADGCVAVLQNATLVRKIYFPRAILPLTTLLSSFFHFAISFVFTLFYYFVVTRSYPEHLRWEFLMVVPTLFFTLVLCLGCTYILSYLNVLYEDVRFITMAMLNIFFYALPMLYTVEDVRHKLQGQPWLFHLYMLNPMATFLATYQRALLHPPTVKTARGEVLLSIDIAQLWPYFLSSCAFSTVLLMLGFYLFERHKWEIAERL